MVQVRKIDGVVDELTQKMSEDNGAEDALNKAINKLLIRYDLLGRPEMRAIQRKIDLLLMSILPSLIELQKEQDKLMENKPKYEPSSPPPAKEMKRYETIFEEEEPRDDLAYTPSSPVLKKVRRTI